MNPTKLDLKFNKKLKISQSDDVYLMQICLSDDKKIACLSSDKSIHVFNEKLDESTCTKLIKPHKDSIVNEISFYKRDSNKLATCGDDGIIKIWNLTNLNKPEAIFDYGKDKVKFLSIDINKNDHLLAASTSSNKDNESFVYLIDLKSLKLIKKYTDAHSDDITQCRFDKENAYRLLTASMDGLVCHFELSSLFETKAILEKIEKVELKEESDDPDDDLIETVYNIDASIQKIGYFNTNKFYAITFTNQLAIYDFKTQDLLYRLDLNENRDNFNKCDYILDCIEFKDRILLCLGKFDGTIELYDKESALSLNYYRVLTIKKHNDVIRSLYNDEKFVYTAGEDSLMVKWELEEINSSSKRSLEDEDLDDKNEIKNRKIKKIKKKVMKK